MPDVLVFKETLLPPSETFILAQMGALRRYTGTLVGLERFVPSLPLPPNPILLSDASGTLARYRAKLYRRLPIAPRFHARARRRRPALVHAHFGSGGVSAIPLARALRVPLVVTLHGADVTVRDSRADRYARLAREATLFLCVSSFIRDQALACGLPAEKLRVHPIGLDRTQFPLVATPTTDERIVFVGRLVEKKGCADLLRAMHSVQRARPAAELVVLGDGPLRASLEALARELELNCRFLGTRPSAVVRETLEQARIFCGPSVQAPDGDSEGLGIVFAEAAAMGIPVVSTRHGGIPEIVADGRTGLLVPEHDPAALADALTRLLSDTALWERCHQAGPAHIATHFDLAKQTEELEEIYASLPPIR